MLVGQEIVMVKGFTEAYYMTVVVGRRDASPGVGDIVLLFLGKS
jgi:hypothetical protein